MLVVDDLFGVSGMVLVVLSRVGRGVSSSVVAVVVAAVVVVVVVGVVDVDVWCGR